MRSFGILGKSDVIDVWVLAAYARERHAALARWQPADRRRDWLQAFVLLRRDVVDERVTVANRRGVPSAEVLASFPAPQPVRHARCHPARQGRAPANPTSPVHAGPVGHPIHFTTAQGLLAHGL